MTQLVPTSVRSDRTANRVELEYRSDALWIFKQLNVVGIGVTRKRSSFVEMYVYTYITGSVSRVIVLYFMLFFHVGDYHDMTRCNAEGVTFRVTININILHDNIALYFLATILYCCFHFAVSLFSKELRLGLWTRNGKLR